MGKVSFENKQFLMQQMSQSKILNHLEVTTDLVPGPEQKAEPEKNSQVLQTKSSKYLLFFPIKHRIYQQGKNESLVPYFPDPKTDQSSQPEEENETPYKATLQILFTHLGQVMLKLEFDKQTVKTLTKEISCRFGDDALLKFVIEAKNTKTNDTYSMVFKGAVAPTHCMRLALNLQNGGEYMFGVEVQKFGRDTKQFFPFMKREVTFAPALFYYYYEPQVLASNEVSHNRQGGNINNGLAFNFSPNIFPHLQINSSGNFPLTPAVSASGFLETQPLVSTYTSTVAPYNASLEAIPSDLRKVTLQLTFDSPTVERLRCEISNNMDERALMKFILRANNTKTRATRTMIFKGAASRIHRMSFDSSLNLGHKYAFEVEVQKYSPDCGEFATFLRRYIKYKEVLRQTELWELLQRAAVFRQCQCTEDLEVQFAYRNKPRPYFDRIMQKDGGIMKVYIKDNNGDPGCPINKQINGLFFGVRIDPKTRTLPRDSYFGNRRIIMPIERFMKEPVKLYFADFYCHSTVHYVTLVTTKPDSRVDVLCREHLLELSLENNPFFCRIPCASNTYNTFTTFVPPYKFYCSRVPCVEILYTEDIDLKQEEITWQTVPTLGRGSSTEHGIPKRPDCDICNLYPVPRFVAQQTF